MRPIYIPYFKHRLEDDDMRTNGLPNGVVSKKDTGDLSTLRRAVLKRFRLAIRDAMLYNDTIWSA